MPSDKTESFTYSSQPHSAPVTKRLNSGHEAGDNVHGVPLTMMSDPRVIRGNTHSLAKRVTKSKSAFLTMNHHGQVPAPKSPTICPTYSYQVKSFANNEIDVSQYLVQQDDYPVQIKDVNNQTDDFFERPVTPEYIPRKTGIDRSTQVEDVRELFDFDLEVEPILEVIVRKTFEQSLFEIQSEHELSTLESVVREFHALNKEENEWMRNKEIEVIKEAIKTKVQIQSLEVRSRTERTTRSLVAGLQMMRQLLPSVVENAMTQNLLTGLWVDPLTVVITEELLPVAIQDAVGKNDAFSTAQMVVDDLLMDAQERYMTCPTQSETTPREMVIKLTFCCMEETATNEDSLDNAPAVEVAGGHEANSVTLSFALHPRDTVTSLQRLIRNELSRLKTPPAATEEENVDEIPALFDASLAAKLPDITFGLNLKKRLSALLMHINGGPEREIANDASLFNFPFPNVIDFEYVFHKQ